MMSVDVNSGFFSTPKKMMIRRTASSQLDSPYSPTRLGEMKRSDSVPFSLNTQASPKKSAPSSPTISRSSSRVDLVDGDRFIPSRSPLNIERSSYSILHNIDQNNIVETNSSKELFKSRLSEVLFDSDVSDSSLNRSPSGKILSFSEKAPTPSRNVDTKLKVLYQSKFKNKITSSRTIPTREERILDAPDILDDYYLNLLDWGSNNILAIALSNSIYLWNAGNGAITQLLSLSDGNYVTSLSFSESGQYLSVGTQSSEVQIWDVKRCKQLRSMDGHHSRVGSLAWNGQILSSGSRDSNIVNHDVRVPNHMVSTFSAHTQEVCGLKWSPDGSQLASGGNDNILNIWTMDSETPVHTFTQHQAGVKAVAWCPWQKNLLATGGGSVDRTIRFWNTSTGVCLNSIDTQSQVCSILWSKQYKELISSHGYSHNQLVVWKYPTMKKQAELSGHTSRVLYMAMSPDGTTVASAAPDETLRFWKVFDNENKHLKRSSSRSLRDQGKMKTISIR